MALDGTAASSGIDAMSTVAHITTVVSSRLVSVPLVVGNHAFVRSGFAYAVRSAGSTTLLLPITADAGAIPHRELPHASACAGNPSAYHPLAAELGRIMATVSKVSEIP